MMLEIIKLIINNLKNMRISKFPKHPLIKNSIIDSVEKISDKSVIRNAKIYGNVAIKEHSKIEDVAITGNVVIGCHTSINGPNTDIWAMVNWVRIGNFCSIARNVSIQEYDHKFDYITSYFIHPNLLGGKMDLDIRSKGDINIGNDVWVGTQTVILSGAKISNGAVIGANSVVNSYIPPYAIAVGSPAKVVKYRFSNDLIAKLIELSWWDWDDEKIKRNNFLFESPLTIEMLDQLH